MKSYKFKIQNPRKAIVQRVEQTLDLCRELYNAGLQERRDAYKLNRISITYQDQQNQLPEIKAVRDDLSNVYSQVLQEALKRLDKSFQGFFRRIKAKQTAGFPRFKGQNRYDSFAFPQTGFKLDGNVLTLSKIGKVKLHLSQNVVGKVKTCTIKKEVSGWFVVFTVENNKELLPKTGKSIGIDAGIESFITLSNGEQIENFRYFESSQKALRVAQRSVSRKRKGSNSRKKAVVELKKIHAKIKHQRNDFAHKVSTKLVKDFDVIAIEDLNIKGMTQGKLAKQINDVAWNSFFQKLTYKAENAGKKLIKVNPNYTSQTCLCGHREKKTLAQRWHHCLECGLSIHRDILSSKIILSLGQSGKDLTYLNRESVSLESLSITASV